jgi:hypothetical protein
LYDRIQIKENVLCELRKKYIRMNLKEVCQLDSNSLSCSLTVTSRFLVTIVISQRAGGGASKKR